MIKIYQKKPVRIEAIQYTGDNFDEIKEFVGDSYYENVDERHLTLNIGIKTLEGDMTISLFDYVIKGVNGEFYPCKPDIFKKTYDEIN